MQTQNMTHAQIAIPADNLALITDLITKLGGQVMNYSCPYPSCNPMPEVERGGKMLKELRHRAGLTQKKVASTLGIPQSHISEFERNKRNIPYKHAQKLATLLHTIPSHFMMPNNETREAMDELGKGKGERCVSVEKLFDSLEI
ncbi:MAG: helix-turn-helix transcriptional regulator [Desulfoplanes sp.]|nr:helix-turn-helix transcriptional regulator [Desulfoplanes sp.]MDD4648518.1 helix-turn-helix transcriptional regulator [Desulfoplanes sp.]